MKAVIHDFYTEIFLESHEFYKHCTPGQGADTCSWVVSGGDGFECTYHNKPYDLVNRREAGEMTAMRDGCDKVREFSPMEHGECTVIF